MLKKSAAYLHEELRNYGSLKDIDKPLLVSTILLAIKSGLSSEKVLASDVADCPKLILNSCTDYLKGRYPDSSNVDWLTDTLYKNDMFYHTALNTYYESLEMTPLQFFYSTIYNDITEYAETVTDIISLYYTEFMSYSGGDGQNLGIVLTPEWVTQLVAAMGNLRSDATLFDPCMGTGSFLIAGAKAGNCSVMGCELQPHMYAICLLNLATHDLEIDELFCVDFIGGDLSQLKRPTAAFLNPPFSQGTSKTQDRYEIAFISKSLDMLEPGGCCIALLPQSAVCNKSRTAKQIKSDILKKHHLEGTIRMNPFLFDGVYTDVILAVFTSYTAADLSNKKSRFVDFTNDGFDAVGKSFRRFKTAETEKQIKKMLDVWRSGRTYPDIPYIDVLVSAEQDWTYGSFCEQSKIPDREIFTSIARDAVLHDINEVLNCRHKSLIIWNDKERILSFTSKLSDSDEKKWNLVPFSELFDIKGTKFVERKNIQKGIYPYITCSSQNFGQSDCCDTVTEDGNVLLIESATIGTCTYQKNPFTPARHLEKLIPYFDMDYSIGLFLMGAINHSLDGKFTYGFKANKKRLATCKVMLPVLEDGQPDFAYMSDYMLYSLCQELNKIR